MKKVIISLCIVMMMLLCACTGKDNNTNKPEGNNSKFTQTDPSGNGQESTGKGQESTAAAQESSGQNNGKKDQESSAKPEESSQESKKPEESSQESKKPEESSQNSSKTEESSSKDDRPDWLKNATSSQQAAYEYALYLYQNDYYSYSGLVDAVWDEYDYDDSVWAVDHLDVDWYDEATHYCESLCYSGPYSRLTLDDNLDYKGFDADQISYAIDHCNVDWEEEAVDMTETYLENYFNTPNGVYDWLITHWFSEIEANYGIANADVDWYEIALSYANHYIFNNRPVTEYAVKMQFLDSGFTNDQIEYALGNCDADYDQFALERAQQLVDDSAYSPNLISYGLSMEGYNDSNISYALMNVIVNWQDEAYEAAVYYTDMYPSCTHEELFYYLNTDLMFDYDVANYGCSAVGK